MPNEEKILLKIVRWGVYAILIFTPLLIFSGFIYPYITTKTIFFRLIISIITPFYFYLIYKYPKWRPNKSWLFNSFLIFGLVALITSLLGVNVLKSIFGDLERMWGVMTVLHLIMFFTILISVFKTEKDWLRLFRIVIWTATLVGIYGLAQKYGVSFIIRAGISRIETTLGNAAFVAGYFLLTLGATVFVMYKDWLKKNKIKILYIISLIIQLMAFVFAGIRGAYLGFFTALILFFIVTIIRQKSKKLKLTYLFIFVILAGIYAFIYSNRLKPWVYESTYLSRLTSVTNIQSNTVKTRFISWAAGFEGFKKTPILGIGMENYNVYFDKYLPAELYNYSRTETWFDRAHNAVVEVLVANGIIGLISYLAIFVILVAYLLKIFQKDKEKNFYVSFLFALIFLVYFIQNFFVFDTLVVIILFIMYAALVNYLYLKDKENLEEKTPSLFDKKVINYLLIVVFTGLAVYSVVINIKMSQIAYLNTKAQYAIIKNHDYKEGYEYAKKTLAVNSTLDYFNNKSANILVDSLVGELNRGGDGPKLIEAIEFALDKLEKDVEKYPSEVYSLVVLGRSNNALSGTTDDQQLKNQYLEKANYYLNRTIELSLGRLQIYYILAQNSMLRDNFEETIGYLDTAINLNPDFPDSYWFKGLNYFNFGYEQEGLENINIALDKKYSLSNLEQALTIVAYAAKNEDYPTIIKLYKVIIALEPDNPQFYANLATTYAVTGDIENATFYAYKAAELDPSFKDEAEEFVRQIEAGEFSLPEQDYE